MIIDEGFLSNAKKIASTQPQQNEVRVPEIRRENFEYHIEIKYKNIESIEKASKRILSCDIFKEKGNIDLDHSENMLVFDADMFITIDTVHELLYYMNRYASILDITGKKLIYIDVLDYHNTIYKLKMMCMDDYTADYMYDEYGEFGIGRNALTRWMIRNSIIILLDSSVHYNKFVYPVRITYDEICRITGEHGKEYINTDYAFDISNNIKHTFIKEPRHNEYMESLKDRSEYIIYMEDSYIYIYTAYPVMFEGGYIYQLFRIDSEFSEYWYLRNMIDNSIKKSEKVKNIDTGDIDFIDYGKFKEECRNMKTMRYSCSAYLDPYCELSDVKMSMFNCDLFRKYRINRITQTGVGDNEKIVMMFDAEIDMTVENIYQFITRIIKSECIKKDNGKLMITDRQTGKTSEVILPAYYCSHIEKNRVIKDMDGLTQFEETTEGLIDDPNELYEWENNNGILYITTLENKDNYTGALFIDDPSKIPDMLKGKYETAVLDKKREHVSKINEGKLIGILESKDIHDYMVDFTINDSYASMSIYPMYPVLIGKEYGYPCIVSIVPKDDDQYKYICGIAEKMFEYLIYSGMKVSDISFGEIENDGNVKKKFL